MCVKMLGLLAYRVCVCLSPNVSVPFSFSHVSCRDLNKGTMLCRNSSSLLCSHITFQNRFLAASKLLFQDGVDAVGLG